MKQQEMTEVYEKLHTMYGLEAQLRMVQEECAELIVAASKVIREPDNPKRGDDIIEEAADVAIMIGQLRTIYGGERIDEMMLKKCDRLRKRLEARLLATNEHE